MRLYMLISQVLVMSLNQSQPELLARLKDHRLQLVITILGPKNERTLFPKYILSSERWVIKTFMVFIRWTSSHNAISIP